MRSVETGVRRPAEQDHRARCGAGPRGGREAARPRTRTCAPADLPLRLPRGATDAYGPNARRRVRDALTRAVRSPPTSARSAPCPSPCARRRRTCAPARAGCTPTKSAAPATTTMTTTTTRAMGPLPTRAEIAPIARFRRPIGTARAAVRSPAARAVGAPSESDRGRRCVRGRPRTDRRVGRRHLFR